MEYISQRHGVYFNFTLKIIGENNGIQTRNIFGV